MCSAKFQFQRPHPLFPTNEAHCTRATSFNIMHDLEEKFRCLEQNMLLAATFDIAPVGFLQNRTPSPQPNTIPQVLLLLGSSLFIDFTIPVHPAKDFWHLFLDCSIACWVSLSMKASFCPHPMTLPTILKSNFYCCCWLQSSGYHCSDLTLLGPSNARIVRVMHEFHQMRPERQTLFCRLLASLLFIQSLLRWAVPDHIRYGLAPLCDHFIVRPFITSLIPSFQFFLVR